MDTWKEPHPRRLPTAEEIQETQAIVGRLEDELCSLSRDIDQLQRKVSQLQKERAQRISFIAPFRRLPTEIVAKIAQICIDAGDSPNTLNRVCSSMRIAVNGMKSLWGTIHLVPYRVEPRRKEIQGDGEPTGRLSRRGRAHSPRPQSTSGSKKDGHFCVTLEHLQALLERVEGTTIDFSVTQPDIIRGEMIDMALSYSTHFRSLAVVLGPGRFHIPVVDLPMLENLQVQSVSVNSSVRNILRMADERAPQLRNLYLEIHSASDFPLTEMARYQFHYRLKNLYLATGSKAPLDPSAPVLDLPELETLTLIGKPWILAYMILPRLSTLAILGGTKKRNQRIVPPHFPTSITRLHLDHVRFTTYSSTAVLLPNLTHLDLRYPSVEVLDPHFRLPALETMRMDSITYNGLFRSAPEQSTISALFSGEGVLKDLTSLRRLLLEEIHLETTSCNALRGIPTLQEWEMRGCSIPHDLAETLTMESEGKKILFPHLQRLHVKGCWSMSESAEILEDRVRSAVAQSRPTMSVTFVDNQTDI